MNNNINNEIIDRAIQNAESISYPIEVNGAEYGQDLAAALRVIKELSCEVIKLGKIIDGNLHTQHRESK